MHRAFIVLVSILLPVSAGLARGEAPLTAASWETFAPTARFASPGLTPSGLLLPGPRLALETAPAPADAADRKLFTDWILVSKEYGFAVVGQAVAGALGFYIGSGIETAISGEEKAHKGWLSFTDIRYDNYYGAFWGGVTGSLIGSSLTTYFVGQTDEEDGSIFWTAFGAAAAGAGALYIATEMGVEESKDWKPFIPLLAIPSVGGVLGFNVSRWFSDRKREKVVGPDGSAWHWQPPSVAFGPQGFEVRALHLTF